MSTSEREGIYYFSKILSACGFHFSKMLIATRIKAAETH
jgi:hypothetical protein